MTKLASGQRLGFEPVVWDIDLHRLPKGLLGRLADLGKGIVSRKQNLTFGHASGSSGSNVVDCSSDPTGQDDSS